MLWNIWSSSFLALWISSTCSWFPFRTFLVWARNLCERPQLEVRTFFCIGAWTLRALQHGYAHVPRQDCQRSKALTLWCCRGKSATVFCSGQVYTPEVIYGSTLDPVSAFTLDEVQYSCSNNVSCFVSFERTRNTFEVGIIGLPGFRRDATTFGRASWNTQFGSDSSLACLVDKPCGRFVPWLFLPLKMAQRQHVLSALCRDGMRRQYVCAVLALLSDQLNSFGLPPFDLLSWPVDVGSGRNMDYAFLNSSNVYVGKRSVEWGARRSDGVSLAPSTVLLSVNRTPSHVTFSRTCMHSCQCRTTHWLKVSARGRFMSLCVWLCVWPDTLQLSTLCALHRLSHLPFHSPVLHLHLPCGLVRWEVPCALQQMRS